MLCRCFSEICLFSYIKSNYSLRHSLLLSTYIEPSYHPQTKHINNSAVLRTRGQTLEILNIKTLFMVYVVYKIQKQLLVRQNIYCNISMTKSVRMIIGGRINYIRYFCLHCCLKENVILRGTKLLL